jgi:competence ComEA-like helix-hairpin-helix protein
MVAKKNGKPDLNEASREELVEVAGLKPAKAETIVKLRQEQGPIGSIEQLRDAAKLGKAEIDKLQDSFVVAAKAARETTQEAAKQGGEAAKRVSETAQEIGRRGSETAQRIGETTRQTAQSALGDMGEAGRQMADGMAPAARMGMLWLSFWPEQAAQGMVAAGRLMRCRSLPELVQVQSEFALGSIDRLARRFTSVTGMVANQADRQREAA